jgi:hypothetical protein
MYNDTLRHAPATEPSGRVFCVQDARLLFAANVMLAMDEIRKFGGMSVQDLKLALKDIPGAAGLRLNYAPNGNELVTIAGRTVEVGPMATNAEIIAAFAAPAPPSGTIIIVGEVAPVPAPRPTPITTIAPVTIGTPKMPSITGASSATMTIKDLIAGSRTAVQAAHNKLIQNAGKVNDAAAALDGLGNDLGSEADDLMSMIGQFKNDLTPSTPATPAATPLPPAPAITPA